MNTQQLESCLRQDNLLSSTCLGVFACDQLPLPPNQKLPFGFIANTAPSTEKGTHWVALWFDEKGQGNYFDSFADKIPMNFAKYLNMYSSSWRRANEERYQGALSSVCGQYCLYYLHCSTRNRPIQLGPNYILNDEFVNDFVLRKFSLDVPAYDTEYLVNQVSKMFGK